VQVIIYLDSCPEILYFLKNFYYSVMTVDEQYYLR